MGIGTSLGAYYEDAFQHQSDVHEEIKPKEGIDNNVVTPPEVRQNKEMDKIEETELGGIPVANRIYVSPNRDDIGKAPLGVGGPAEVGNDQAETLDNIATKLTGSGTERYQTWPERMFRQAFDTFKKGMDGGIPGYVMDPETGDFHTSPEMMDAAHDMMPLAMSGAMPATVQLRGAAQEVMSTLTPETRTAAQDAISSIRRSGPTIQTYRHQYDPENTARGMLSSDPTERALASIEHALYGDEVSGASGVAAQRESAFRALNGRTDLSNQERGDAIEAIRRQLPLPRDQEGLTIPPRRPRPYTGDTLEARALTPEETSTSIANREATSKAYVKAQEARKSDKLQLIEAGKIPIYEGNSHKFLFANKNGIGRLSITETDKGKSLYVNGIYGEKGAWQYDTPTIKSLVKLLKDEFPNAETLSGFRVSGARAATGSGPARASMTLRKPYDHVAHTKYREGR